MKSAAVVVAVALSASAASAQSFTFGLTGGVGVPMGDYGDDFKAGYEAGVFGDYWVSPNLGIGVDIVGNFHDGTDDLNAFLTLLDLVVTETPDDVQGKMTTIQFGAHGKWLFPSESLSPYLTAGAGLYNMNFDIRGGELAGDSSQSRAGINGGGGVDFKMGNGMLVGGGVKLHHVFTPDGASQYIQVGVNLTFKTSAK